ncbi:putative feruloyl esterase B precursor [Cadophora sp. MPI-SDFR-AT-0126]|nr:putative feruloyl esterase B precursor [Leotiomycetes sp. MPI-SDFR-AT-0126]
MLSLVACWLFGLILSISASIINRNNACSGFIESLPQSPSNVRIVSSTYVPAGELVIENTTISNTLSFCQISGKIKYGGETDSEFVLNFQLWLPDVGDYNGRYLSVGNGGFGGGLDIAAMVLNLSKGYAVAAGDSGHQPEDINAPTGPGRYVPFFHHHDQVLAWIRNSIAMFTLQAKELTGNYYSEKAKYSYYSGCSTGGGQAYALALYHPDLFDGIYAGCPGNSYSNLMVSFIFNHMKASGGGFLPQESLDFITDSVLAECDELDGVRDGILENPLACDFNITTLQCPVGVSHVQNNQTLCLTTEQVATARAFYTGPFDSRKWNGTQIYPGFSVGSESQWLSEETTLSNLYAVPLLQNLVYDDLTWDVSTFDYGSDLDLINEKASAFINHMSPDLSSFRNSGGKFLTTQGWADPLNPAILPIHHLNEIETFFNEDSSDWYRLFMIPGGGHCGAVPDKNSNVPATYASLEALTAWVETGEAPSYIVSSKPPNGETRTRKLCPWPQIAKYSGGGVDDYTSFQCARQ